jgi:hypothetical protein
MDVLMCSTGNPVPIPIHPSNVVITKLKLDKDRKDLLARKDRSKMGDKGAWWCLLCVCRFFCVSRTGVCVQPRESSRRTR